MKDTVKGMRRLATDWEEIFAKTYLIKDYYLKDTKNC